MSAVYALDTNICIWAIRDALFPELKGDLSQEAENIRQRAVHLLAILGESKSVTVIPSIVLAEIMIPLTHEQQSVFMDKVSLHSEIVDFDAMAAIKYVEMWQKHKVNGLIKMNKEEGISNREIKNDHAIAATCLARGVNCLFTNDAKLRNFCMGFMEAKDLPKFPRQQNVYGEWEFIKTGKHPTEFL